MYCFFAEPFLRKYPAYLIQSLIHDDLTIPLLQHALRKKVLAVLTEGQALTTVMEELSISNKEYYTILSSLVASNSIHHAEQPSEIPHKLASCKAIRKGVLKHLSLAVNENVQMAWYDQFESENWQNILTDTLGKPIFTEKDIKTGKYCFLFQINPHTIKLGEIFSWNEILTPILFPFKVIRILDPFLFKHIKNIRLDDIIQILCHKSNRVEIEIISNSEKLTKESDLYDTVLPFFKNLSQKLDHINIKVYTQGRTASKRFHKRVIWTEYWAAHIDWGFDFLQKSKTAPAVNVTTSTNNIFITGRYKSADSNWNEIDDQWGQYIKESKRLHY